MPQFFLNVYDLYTYYWSSMSIYNIKITSRTTGAKGCKFEQFDLYWTIFFIYLGPSCLSPSILVCLNLSWFISVYRFSWDYLFLFIMVYIELYWVIEGYFGQKLDISGYHGLSRALSEYNEISWLLFWKSILNSLLKIRNNF